MSDKPSGFLETIGRFIKGGTSSAQKEQLSNESTSAGLTSPIRSTNANTSFLKDIVDVGAKLSPTKKVGNSLKYLSPSALDSSFQKRNRTLNGLEIEVEPVSDIFSTPALGSQSRKRQLTETDRSLLSPTFRGESVKRVKDFGNRSLLEPTLRSTIGSTKLDTTWSGQFSTCHSPASSVTNVSLLSMNTASTNGSSTFSSSTKHLLKKLEGANTPARDVQRMTMIRAGYSRPEKWASSSVSSGGRSDAPPLRKAGENIQSRIQLLSKNMSLPPYHKQYWRDLTRRRSDPKRNEESNNSSVPKTANGNTKSNELSSLFSIETPSSNNKTIEAPKKPHQAVVKGSDGKSLGKNTFKFNDEDLSVPVPENFLKDVEPLKLDAAPPKGFLGKLSFSFGAPVDVVSLVKAKKFEQTIVDSDQSEKSDGDDTNSGKSDDSSDDDSDENNTSDSDEESEGQASSESEKEIALKSKEESRPQTSTDTVSPAVSLLSSKNSSPKTNVVAPLQSSNDAVEEKKTAPATNATWSCDGCFTSWPESTNECGCCGTKKEGSAAPSSAPAQKTLVSNISTFSNVSKPSGVSFGFGSGVSTSASTAPVAPVISNETSSTTTPAVSFGISSTVQSTTVPVTLPTAPSTIAPVPASIAAPTVDSQPAVASSSDRVAWDCPDCMVSNKSTDDKCPCCGHEKYKSTSGAPSNVFGDRAFKPSVASTGGFTFGVQSASSTSAATPTFGLSAKPAETTSEKAPEAKPMFGTSIVPAPTSVSNDIAPVTSSTSATSNIAPIEPKSDIFSSTTATSKASMFGSSSGSLFGTSNSTLGSSAKPAESAAPQSLTFGIPTSSENKSSEVSKAPTNVFGNIGLTSTPSEPPKTNPFGLAPTGNLFGSSTSTAVTAPPAFPEVSKPAIFGTGSTTSGLFGSTTTSIEAPKPQNIFGTSTTGNMFGAPTAPPPSSQNVANIFGSSTSSSFPPPPMFGSSNDTHSLFGNQSQGNDSTDGAPAAKKGSLFSAAADSTTKPFGAFGAPAATSSLAAPAPFGGAFGNGSSFGGFGAQPSVQPTISNSSSTSSLFNSAPGPAPIEPQQNLFSSTTVPSSFNFGGNSMNGNGVFMFGGSSAAPPSVPNTQPPAFGQFSAPSGGENAFAYQASTAPGGRKMAMARRRNLKK